MRAAYFSDFMGDCRQETARRQRIEAYIQELTGERPNLVAVMSGDFFQNGCISPVEKERRVKQGLLAGAEAVVEMSCFASLSSVGIFAFSGARLLDKLGSVELLVLETRDAGLEQLTEISHLLIANDIPFQRRVSFYKDQGDDFYRAQARAVGERIVGGEQIMSCWDNIFAVECIKSLKLMYSGIRCVCLPLAEGRGLFGEEQPGLGMGRRLDELLQYQLYFSEMQLSDIYGGHEELTNQILAQRDCYEGFFAFAERLAGRQVLYDIRKYLLRLLCGIRKSAIELWRMYDFAPYLCLHVREEDTARRMAEHSKMPLLVHGQVSFRPDRSREELLRLELQTERICELLRAECRGEELPQAEWAEDAVQGPERSRDESCHRWGRTEQ